MSVDIGPLPEVHPRDDDVQNARKELDKQIEDIRIWYNLTSAELMVILLGAMADFSRSLLKIERRPKRA
jgi:hypothetical protein